MKRLLRPHPASPPSPIRKIAVDAARLLDGRLSLAFMAHGDLARIRIPAERASVQADELWRATCFEAFLRSPDAETYGDPFAAEMRADQRAETHAQACQNGQPQLLIRLAQSHQHGIRKHVDAHEESRGSKQRQQLGGRHPFWS